LVHNNITMTGVVEELATNADDGGGNADEVHGLDTSKDI
jgi:hypothetical protein